MKLFGYSRKNEDSVIDLKELTLTANPKELLELADFFQQCAKEIKEDPSGWEHEHLMDFLQKTQPNGIDVVVYNPDKL